MASDPSKPTAVDPSRLDQIVTQRTLLARAHFGPPDAAGPERNALVLRYARAIRGYVGALLRDDVAADEVAQDVVVKMLQGEFAGAGSGAGAGAGAGVDGARRTGRFRDYLKVAVRNAALSHLRARERRRAADLDAATDLPDGSAGTPDDRWLADCRRTVLDATWKQLEEDDRTRGGGGGGGGGVPYAAVLRLTSDDPQADTETLARRLSEQIGRPCRADAFRKQLSRARRKFAEALVDQVARTLSDAAPADVSAELQDLGLMAFVGDAVPVDDGDDEDGRA